MEWRAVEGWEDIYSISSEGRVRRDAGGKNARPGRLLKVLVDSGGYVYVWLKDRGRVERRLVHFIAAVAFIGPRPPGLTVNHEDGNKLNNAYGNLTWATYGEQMIHAYATGLRAKPDTQGVRNGRAKLTEAEVLEIRASTATVQELAAKYGRGITTIREIRAGLKWRGLLPPAPAPP